MLSDVHGTCSCPLPFIMSITDTPASPPPTDPFRDPENQNAHFRQSQKDRRKSTYLDTLLLPFNMWAPRPNYNLRERLSNQDLRDVLVASEQFRTNQWRIAYWVMTVSTAVCIYICRVKIRLIVSYMQIGLPSLHSRNSTHRHSNHSFGFQQPAPRFKDPVDNVGRFWCCSIFAQRFVSCVYASTWANTYSCPNRYRSTRQCFHGCD